MNLYEVLIFQRIMIESVSQDKSNLELILSNVQILFCPNQSNI